MKDVQNSLDRRGIAIEKVGVSEVHLPFLIRTKTGDYQSVLACIKLTVDLSEQYKGTHMSRFVEILNEWNQKPVDSHQICYMLKEIAGRLEARRADIEVRFKYFMAKSAPVSQRVGMLDYDCMFIGTWQPEQEFTFILGIEVPFTSLCPCSKEISSYGAHNQRGMMKVKLCYQPEQFIWLEDLAELLESQASSPIYPLLKREDEKYVTERAYENPKFVEDTLRDVVLALRTLPGVLWFEVECENYESIHNHNAYAYHRETVGEDC